METKQQAQLQKVQNAPPRIVWASVLLILIKGPHLPGDPGIRLVVGGGYGSWERHHTSRAFGSWVTVGRVTAISRVVLWRSSLCPCVLPDNRDEVIFITRGPVVSLLSLVTNCAFRFRPRAVQTARAMAIIRFLLRDSAIDFESIMGVGGSFLASRATEKK